MLNELKHIETSKPFVEWMTLLNGGTPEIITKDRLINGLCEDLAYYLHVKYKVKIINVTYFHPTTPTAQLGHYFVQYTDGKFYDGWNRDGIEKV